MNIARPFRPEIPHKALWTKQESIWKNRTSVNAARMETSWLYHRGHRGTQSRSRYLDLLCEPLCPLWLKVLLQAFQESHDLPALLLRQARPGWHSIFHAAVFQQPFQFAGSRRAYLLSVQVRIFLGP